MRIRCFSFSSSRHHPDLHSFPTRRSSDLNLVKRSLDMIHRYRGGTVPSDPRASGAPLDDAARTTRSEEHTSELQSHSELVCRLLLEKKKNVTQHGASNGYVLMNHCSSGYA